MRLNDIYYRLYNFLSLLEVLFFIVAAASASGYLMTDSSRTEKLLLASTVTSWGLSGFLATYRISHFLSIGSGRMQEIETILYELGGQVYAWL